MSSDSFLEYSWYFSCLPFFRCFSFLQGLYKNCFQWCGYLVPLKVFGAVRPALGIWISLVEGDSSLFFLWKWLCSSASSWRISCPVWGCTVGLNGWRHYWRNWTVPQSSVCLMWYSSHCYPHPHIPGPVFPVWLWICGWHSSRIS